MFEEAIATYDASKRRIASRLRTSAQRTWARLKGPSARFHWLVKHAYMFSIDFQSRGTRRELFCVLIWILIGTAIAKPILAPAGSSYEWLLLFYAIPLPACAVRRLNDMGWHKIFLLAVLHPVGAYILLAALLIVPPRSEATEDVLLRLYMPRQLFLQEFFEEMDPRTYQGTGVFPRLW